MVGISCKLVIEENGEKIKWKKKIKIGLTLIDILLYFFILFHLFTWILNNLKYILILNIFDFENYFSINYGFSLNNFLIIKYNLNDFPHKSYFRKSLKIPKMTFFFFIYQKDFLYSHYSRASFENGERMNLKNSF